MLPDEIGKPDLDADELLLQIERGELPLQMVIGRLVELIIKLHAKERQLDSLIQSLPIAGRHYQKDQRDTYPAFSNQRIKKEIPKGTVHGPDPFGAG